MRKKIKGFSYYSIDEKGIVTDTLRTAIKTQTVAIPEEYNDIKPAIYSTLRKCCGSLNIKNADEKVEIKLNKQVQLSPEFKDLWDRIKWKTRYNVDFDSNKLIEECVKAISDKVIIGSSVINETKATLNISQGGIISEETQNRSRTIEETAQFLPDIVSYLQNETNLTRKTIVDILLKSNQDEKESGLRKILNFGHTLAHALETITKYKKYTHGEAVVYGMFFIYKINHLNFIVWI